ncbi:MAG: D-glycero-beta-D-manno-heptose 1,7-bisphosphate 7-phosphatase [Woeseia sp.]|nr:D-glycero-beta-D-manno-heptose 1,7-bisphosphate 7-phosphatase [Woeseia sp.]NNE61468.1 D-glycero-beta-D-manno-heptose 1,7-bisphosphate 7-phosphatase [Woeseia sp.]NNL53871.1 D-glycero-beta-D-manno-heptose 1,7-bisphosphate 7-phosphatase [Woeseia sp.]
MTGRLVILDRDGVLNRESKSFIKSSDEWLPLAGSMEALGLLSKAGYTIAVATNQSGLGRGLFDRQALYAMHRKLRRLAAKHGANIDRIVYCPHRPDEGCDCRKPLPGLLERLARHYDRTLDGVPVVGDSLRDLDAASAAGATPVLVLTGNGVATAAELAKRRRSIETHDNLLAFAKSLVNKK